MSTYFVKHRCSMLCMALLNKRNNTMLNKDLIKLVCFFNLLLNECQELTDAIFIAHR